MKKSRVNNKTKIESETEVKAVECRMRDMNCIFYSQTHPIAYSTSEYVFLDTSAQLRWHASSQKCKEKH